MKEIYQDGINLIKCALSGMIYNKSVNHVMFKLMRSNGLAGTVFKALDQALIDESVFRLFKEEYYLYIKKDQTQLAVIDELRSLFNENDIDFIFLKGSFLKTIYPESYMRSMGDIDCLVKPESMELIHQVLVENGYKNWVVSANHDCYMKYGNINVEVHPKLDSEFTDGYEKLLSDPWENAFSYNQNEYQLYPEFNLLYQIYHMIKHMYSSGVGFRTLVDLTLMIKKHEKILENIEKKGLLVNFKQGEFFNFILAYINEFFTENMLSQYINYDKINKMFFEDFTDFIFVSGIHGIGEDYNLFVGGIANKTGESKNVFLGKIKFLFSRVFLPKKQMEVMYPFVRKCVLLLPFAWVMRIFRLIFKKNKSTVRKMRRFSVSKEEVIRVENLFNNIGL